MITLYKYAIREKDVSGLFYLRGNCDGARECCLYYCFRKYIRGNIMQNVYFVTNQIAKYNETKEALDKLQENVGDDKKWNLLHIKQNISEVQTDNVDELVEKKALEAFKKFKRMVLVEQTSLQIEALGGLPGLQSAYFLSNCRNGSMEEILRDTVNFCAMKNDFNAKVETNFCLCDGKKFFKGKGTIEGRIVEKYPEKKSDSQQGFGWDCIFIPGGNKETYAENFNYKLQNSMRKSALADLLKAIEGEKLFIQHFNDNDTNQVMEELAELITEKRVILFIGSGISASVGLPPWRELMGGLGENLGFDQDIFRSYGDSLMLAEYIMTREGDEAKEKLQELFDITNDKNTEAYEKLMDEETAGKLYKMLSELEVPVIYTTNFDNLLEVYSSQIMQRECCVCKSIGDIQKDEEKKLRIMKFHGDISQINDGKDGIVFSESQYYKRMQFDSFMDIQLQADLQKYHILFLGYSLSDVNVKLLMYMVRNRWENEKNKLKTYIFTATPNIIQKEVFSKHGIISISNDETDKFQSTLKFIETLRNLVVKDKEDKNFPASSTSPANKSR